MSSLQSHLTILEQALDSLRGLPAGTQRQLGMLLRLDKTIKNAVSDLKNKRHLALQALNDGSNEGHAREMLENCREREAYIHTLYEEKIAVSQEVINVTSSFVARIEDDIELLRQVLEDHQVTDGPGIFSNTGNSSSRRRNSSVNRRMVYESSSDSSFDPDLK